ncbi:helix-turn-helix domain-containing protein [Anaeroarcus burkinensis]|uniref:helix-turn-helix domain-containing protein n=1 Tax=Anaeroarcus burkinensis TaxID=82376 RepID=UPI000406A34D|nr:AraC family transcriptional regulator [Anaeroarcus burkinensis]
MTGIGFYRDEALPFFELKLCQEYGVAYKKHAHEEYSLGFVVAGGSSFWCEGAHEDIVPQTMLLLPPGCMHACKPVGSGIWNYQMLFVAAEWVQALAAERPGSVWTQPILKPVSSREMQRLERRLHRLQGQETPLAKEAVLIDLFDELQEGDKKMWLRQSGDERPRLRKVKEYLQSRFAAKVTLEELGAVSGLNKFYLLRLFKEAFKIPPHMYQMVLRINFAKRELGKWKEPAEVAQEAGFYDQSHFNKTFKSFTGITPEKYQKGI